MTPDPAERSATQTSALMRTALLPLEIAVYRLNANRLSELPAGDGHAVMLVPGFGFSDDALRPLTRVLRRLGYATYDWGEGRNLGMRPQIRRRLIERLQELHARHRSKVSLIGWSLGGVFARELARAQPRCVRNVVTLGSPSQGYELAEDLFNQTRLMLARRSSNAASARARSPAPPVPCLAIYSKTDGFVDWRASREDPAPNTANVEVRASHLGLLYSPEVVRAIAERLARRPEPRAAKRSARARPIEPG